MTVLFTGQDIKFLFSHRTGKETPHDLSQARAAQENDVRHLYLNPLRDVQLEPPSGTCDRCGCDLYPCDNGEICEKCKEESENGQQFDEQKPADPGWRVP